MKKKCYLSFLLALVMVLSVAVCGGVSAQAQEEATVTMESFDVDAQLSMIFFQLEKLEQKDGENPWYYTVADLDHDGNLEFIAASVHPQDRSTNLKLWEVSNDRSALTACGLEKEEDESFPDIMTDCCDTYYDKETDTWFYMVYDNIVISGNEVYTIKTAVNLKDGIVGYDAFAIEHTVRQNGYRDISYIDANGLPISQEQYNASGANAFAGMERSSTNFDWFILKDVENISRLADSYAVFMGEKEPTEVFPVPKPEALQDPAVSPTPAPSATPVPASIPAVVKNTDPAYLIITKNPTNENRKAGETALFVACSNVFDSLSWTMVSPNGGEYSLQNFAYMFPKASVSGEYSTTLSIANVQKDMNGWGAYCTFYYKGQSARTSTAYIYIKDSTKPSPAPAPAPSKQTEESGIFYGSVYDYGYDSVTVDVPGVDLLTIPKSLCSISGELYVGADAAVYWSGRMARGVNVTFCTIEGRKWTPQPNYGSMSGTAYLETDRLIVVFLQNGDTVRLPTSSTSQYFFNLNGGSVEDIGYAGGGASCIVYYTDYPSVETIYQIDVTVESAPAYIPPAEPFYGSMTGTAYHDTAFTVYVMLDNGTGMHINADVVNIVGGNDIEGARCTVYYSDFLSEDNVYLVDIFGNEPYIEPDPGPVYVEPDYGSDPGPIYVEPDYGSDTGPVYVEPTYDYESNYVPSSGTMEGLAYRQSEDELLIYLDDGNTVYVNSHSWAGYQVNYYGGDVDYAGGGSKCVVYYYDYPSRENVYQVDIY